MTVKLSELRLIEQTRYTAPTKIPTDLPASIPGAVTASGENNLIRIQWATVSGVDGYEVAVMTTPNLAAPDVNIAQLPSDKVREFIYQTGNNALLRYFAVRSYNSAGASRWSAVVSATSTKLSPNDSAGASTQTSTNSASEIVLRTITIAGNTLGANDGVNIKIWGRATTTIDVPIVRIRWGGLTGTIAASVDLSVTGNFFATAEIFNRNATNSQFLGGASIRGTSVTGVTNATAALDTTVNQDIVITGQSAGTDTLFLDLVDSVIVRGTASSATSPPPASPGNPPSGDRIPPGGKFFQ